MRSLAVAGHFEAMTSTEDAGYTQDTRGIEE